MAHILPHWNRPDRTGQITPVHVYTSGDKAELFLNGKKWATAERSTTGKAASLSPDCKRAGDIVFVEITVCDAKGREVPRANPVLDFTVNGGLKILAAGNGDATCHTTMWPPVRCQLTNGKWLVILSAREPGTLKVSAPGLPAASVSPGK